MAAGAPAPSPGPAARRASCRAGTRNPQPGPSAQRWRSPGTPAVWCSAYSAVFLMSAGKVHPRHHSAVGGRHGSALLYLRQVHQARARLAARPRGRGLLELEEVPHAREVPHRCRHAPLLRRQRRPTVAGSKRSAHGFNHNRLRQPRLPLLLQPVACIACLLPSLGNPGEPRLAEWGCFCLDHV